MLAHAMCRDRWGFPLITGCPGRQIARAPGPEAR